jgi:F-type H+-transporting ATPase subunit b
MLIDWFTVGAQALNFMLLVWLMKRFLYQPVQDAIAAREKRIAGTLADADRTQAEAQHDRDDFQHRNEAFDRERAALLASATTDAAAERERLLAAARADADALVQKRQASIDNDARHLGKTLRQHTQEQVFAVSRKVLADLASADVEASAVTLFTRRLRALTGADRETLAGALGAVDNHALVRSAFPLPEAQRAAVQQAVNESFSLAAQLQFETTPDLVGGIEISASGVKFAWSISDDLAALDGEVSALLKASAPASNIAPATAQSAAITTAGTAAAAASA